LETQCRPIRVDRALEKALAAFFRRFAPPGFELGRRNAPAACRGHVSQLPEQAFGRAVVGYLYPTFGQRTSYGRRPGVFSQDEA
jgi:hypothetical protein